MFYEIIIENRAQKDFLKISPPKDKAIRKTVESLAKIPRPHRVKKLSGTVNGYRVRVADYRILYTISDRDKIVTIYRIRHRKEAYK